MLKNIMLNNYLKQKFYYFLGLFIGLSSRVKKFILRLNSPRPRMLPLSDYKKNLDYDQNILNTLSELSGDYHLFENKKILEIGPGPDLLLGLLTLESGAESYSAIDYFPVLSAPLSFYENLKKDLRAPKALRAVENILSSLPADKPIDSPEINYQILGIEKLLETKNKYDLIFSKDVLEHVDDLNSAFRAMRASLIAGGRMIHKIDFQTHTSFIQDKDRLNFLRYNNYIYNNFVKFKGGPNRLRLPEVISLAKANGFEIEKIQIDKQMEADELKKSKRFLSEYYRNLDDSSLLPLSAWIIFH